jgi:predicted DNA-binding ribbon-helix-helix protein
MPKAPTLSGDRTWRAVNAEPAKLVCYIALSYRWRVSSKRSKNGRIKPRPVFVNKRRTSVRIEAEFWFYLRQIAAEKGRTVGAVMGAVDKAKDPSVSLSSALRVYVTGYLRDHPLPVGLRGGS